MFLSPCPVHSFSPSCREITHLAAVVSQSPSSSSRLYPLSILIPSALPWMTSYTKCVACCTSFFHAVSLLYRIYTGSTSAGSPEHSPFCNVMVSRNQQTASGDTPQVSREVPLSGGHLPGYGHHPMGWGLNHTERLICNDESFCRSHPSPAAMWVLSTRPPKFCPLPC